MKEKVNMELASLRADLTNTNVIDSYITHSKSKINSTIQDAEVNKVLRLQGPTNNENIEALGGAAATLSPLSPTDNSNSQSLNQTCMKCYFNHRHHYFIAYSTEPISGHAVIYTGDILFQYN